MNNTALPVFVSPDKPRKMLLIVRDGWGRNPHAEHDAFNAIRLARTPRCEDLLKRFPWTLIRTSGEDVGLPDGTMGNSEVGHQNIGAGRVVDQESVAITKAIRNGRFFENPVIVQAMADARQRGGRVHLLGIASDAGVHGLLDHLYGCVEAARRAGVGEVLLHLFTDGRDTGPFTGREFVRQIEAKCQELGVGRVATLCGRYYAMDRDNRWERVAKAYRLLTAAGDEPVFASADQAMADYYARPTNDSQQGDEFVTPRRVNLGPAAAGPLIRDGDTVVFYNYRGDRPRELVRAFVMPEFYGSPDIKPSPDSGQRGFERPHKLAVRFVTMTAYEESLNNLVQVAYPKPPKMVNIAGQWLSRLGLTQFRSAETEKFPHVTFFFNDYRDEPFPGEQREMAQSPKVATYDLEPQMSAGQICDIVLQRLNAADGQDFILVNFANGDMVGHTGKLDAAIAAVETVDQCVGKLIDAALPRGYAAIVTADHGNAEQMFDPQTQAAHTAHTLYEVECILVAPELERLATGDTINPNTNLRRDGRLADVVPTALHLMGVPAPVEMDGLSLLPDSRPRIGPTDPLPVIAPRTAG